MSTEQSEKWEGEFGTFYTDRNPATIEDVNRVCNKYFGIPREKMNEEFLIELPRHLNILEVGCNAGAQLDGLRKMGFHNFTGVDVSEYALEKAKKTLPKSRFLKASTLELPFEDGEFDLVYTSGVLIHIHPKDLLATIDEIYRVSGNLIWGFEYFSEIPQEIEYRGNKEMLWKRNFKRLFLERHPDLKILNSKKYNYLDNENQDEMYLLEK